MNRAHPTRLFARLVPRGRFSRAVTVLAGGMAASQVVALLASPFLSRIYSPGDFGLFSVYVGLAALLGAAACLKYDAAIPLPQEHSDAAATAAAAALMSLVTAGMTLIIVLVGRTTLAAALHAPMLEGFLLLLPVSVLAAGSYQVVYMWAIRVQDYRRIARTRLSQAIVRFGAQLGLGLSGLTPGGLVIGDVLGQGAGVGTLASAVWRHERTYIRSVRPKSMLRAGRRYIRFPIYGAPGSLLNVFGLQAITILLAWAQGPEVAGWYGLMQRVVGLPMTLVGVAVGETYLSLAPRIAEADPSALPSLFRRTSKRLLVLGSAPAIVLILGGPFLFALVFGTPWRPAGVFAAILAPAVLLQFAVSPLSQTFGILERQHIQFVLDAARAGVTVAVFVFARAFGSSSNATVAAISVSLCGYYTAYYLLCLRALRIHARASLHRQGSQVH